MNANDHGENIWDDTQTVANAQKRIEELEAKCKKMEDALYYTINIYENDDSHDSHDCVRIAKQALGDIK